MPSTMPIHTPPRRVRRRLLAVTLSAVVVLALAGAVAFAAAVATTKAASGVTRTAATLNGQADAVSADSVALFDYGTTPSMGSYTAAKTIPTGPKSVSRKLKGLTPGTPYYFQLIVIENGYPSNAYYGQVLTFKTKK
jgi:hypothetical protein